MKRFGSSVMLDTVMEFHQGKRFNSLYETPFGVFEMGSSDKQCRQ